MIKTSIVIPSMKYELLRTCLQSIAKYTDFSKGDTEVIVVANGMKSVTIDGEVKDPKNILKSIREQTGWFSWICYDEPQGAVRAYNKGIEVAKGEYIIMLNDDCQILESPKNAWVDMLIEPMKQDPKIGITGPLKLYYFQTHLDKVVTKKQAEDGFIVFFCCGIRRELFDKIGLLDENFHSMVDVDMCIASTLLGYKNIQVPDPNHLKELAPRFNVGGFPIYHVGEATVHEYYGQEKWDGILKEDTLKLEAKYHKSISIIIPTYGNNLEALRNCIESVYKNTDLHHVEIIVVANGSSPEVKTYLDTQNLCKVIWEDKQLGFVKATNLGINNSNPEGEFVILLNHDAVIIDSPKNTWIEMLLNPMGNQKIGITGPVKGFTEEIKRNFIMFFCSCIRKKVFSEIGMLDEAFGFGGYDDIDFCIKAENKGWEIAQVPDEAIHDGSMFHGGFPIYHVEHHFEWLNDENLLKNKNLIIERYKIEKELDFLGESHSVVESNTIEKLLTPRIPIEPNWPLLQKKYEILAIQEYIKHVKLNKVLDIGTFEGGTAYLWAKMIEPNGKVYCTDLNFDRHKFYNNTPEQKSIIELKGNTNDPNFVKMIQDTVGMVDLLFIDGDHSYEGVKNDFINFSPLVKPGGCVMLHDITDTIVHRERGVYVWKLWQELKVKFPNALEFIDGNEYYGCPHQSMGIGVIML